MLSMRDEDELVQSLRDLIRIENEIESEKTHLGNKHDFCSIFEVKKFVMWKSECEHLYGLKYVSLQS